MLLQLILIPSAPMDTNLTPLHAIKSSALLTLAILWNLILPRSGLGKVSPDMTSNNSINFNPLRKSSSIFSIWVPAFLKWELTHAVNVWNKENSNELYWVLEIYNEISRSTKQQGSLTYFFILLYLLLSQN